MKFFKSFEFIAMLAMLMGLSALGIDAILPAFSQLSAVFSLTGAHTNDVQLVVYVFMLGFSLVQLFFGILADLFGRKSLLLLGIGIYIFSSILSYSVDSFTGLLWIRFFQGIGLAAPRVLVQAVVRDVASGRDMSRIMSFTMTVFLLIPVVAPSIGQFMLNFGSWHDIFLLFIFSGVIMFCWVSIRLPETLPKKERRKPNLNNVLAAVKVCFTHRPTFIYMMMLSLLFAMIMSYIGQAEQIYGGSVYGLGEKFALAFAVTSLGMIVASFSNSQLVMRLGMHRIVFYALLVMLINDSVHLCSAFFFSGKPPLVMFMPLLIVHLFCFSMTTPNLNSLLLEPYEHIAGTVSAVVGTWMSIVGLFIAHIVASHFNDTVYPLVIGWFLLTITAFCGNLYVNRLTERNVKKVS